MEFEEDGEEEREWVKSRRRGSVGIVCSVPVEEVEAVPEMGMGMEGGERVDVVEVVERMLAGRWGGGRGVGMVVVVLVRRLAVKGLVQVRVVVVWGMGGGAGAAWEERRNWKVEVRRGGGGLAG